MQVAFNNWGFHSGVPEMTPYLRDGVAGYIRAAHDLGFKAYQLQTGSGGLLASAPSFQEVDVVGLREKLQHWGLEMNLHHHGHTACPDAFRMAKKDRIYDEFRDYLKSAITFLQAVGGNVVSFHPPFADNGENPEEVPLDEATRQRAQQVYGELMKEVGDFAGERNVKLAIESAVWGPPNAPWTSIFLSPEQLDEFVKAPGMPESVGILAEISHLHHIGLEIPDLIRLWGPKIQEIHASDAVVHSWTDKKHYSETLVPETHRVVGQGTLDFPATVRALQHMGFEGWLSLELFPAHVNSLEDYVSSRKILESVIQEECQRD